MASDDELRAEIACMKMGHNTGLVADGFERVMDERDRLRIRDSNVTAHCLNVTAINEDLQRRLKTTETDRDAALARAEKAEARVEELECDALGTGDVLERDALRAAILRYDAACEGESDERPDIALRDMLRLARGGK